MRSIFEQNGGTYTKCGDYYIPDLSIPDTKTYNIGKYNKPSSLDCDEGN